MEAPVHLRRATGWRGRRQSGIVCHIAERQSMNGQTSGGSRCPWDAYPHQEELRMPRSSTFTAYLTWIVALVAILMPPALASAGTDILVNARDALYALLEDEPESSAFAGLPADEPGWQA
jgi:hypothetical protein